ncbi:MAG: hypothetical protein O2816_00125 [Planctomycetota bacterium]|nr:hypothetical protein [Planctomycetota bacterium]
MELVAEVEGTRWSVRRGDWFLPLGLWVGEEHRRVMEHDAPWEVVPLEERQFEPDPAREGWLRRALSWSPLQGLEEADEVERLLAHAAQNNQAAADALVALGQSTVLALSERVRVDLDWFTVLDPINVRASGHLWAYRDLDLLLALAAFPEEALRRAALDRLQSILPEGSAIDAAAIQTERSKWTWNAEADAYVAR